MVFGRTAIFPHRMRRISPEFQFVSARTAVFPHCMSEIFHKNQLKNSKIRENELWEAETRERKTDILETTKINLDFIGKICLGAVPRVVANSAGRGPLPPPEKSQNGGWRKLGRASGEMRL